MLFKSTGIVNRVLNEKFFFFFSSELIVNRILTVSVVVNKIFSTIKLLLSLSLLLLLLLIFLGPYVSYSNSRQAAHNGG